MADSWEKIVFGAVLAFIMLGLVAGAGLKAVGTDLFNAVAVQTTITNETIDAVTLNRDYQLNFSTTGSSATGGQSKICIRQFSDRVSLGNGSSNATNATLARGNYTLNLQTGVFRVTSTEASGSRINLTYDYYNAPGCVLKDAVEGTTNQTQYFPIIASIVILFGLVALVVAIFAFRKVF